jgi:hypothetical protein
MLMYKSVKDNRIPGPSLSDVAEELPHVERLGQTYLFHMFDLLANKKV